MPVLSDNQRSVPHYSAICVYRTSHTGCSQWRTTTGCLHWCATVLVTEPMNHSLMALRWCFTMTCIPKTHVTSSDQSLLHAAAHNYIVAPPAYITVYSSRPCQLHISCSKRTAGLLIASTWSNFECSVRELRVSHPNGPSIHAADGLLSSHMSGTAHAHACLHIRAYQKARASSAARGVRLASERTTASAFSVSARLQMMSPMLSLSVSPLAISICSAT